MPEANIKIINQLGLHARAAAQLVRLAGTFKSRVTLMRLDNNVVADAKSILSVLTLAASKGTELRLTVEGADEQEAFGAVKEIFAKGFGEI
ncbi:MAG TPA: HPr family phosphocarrier protein [Pyrinomonadaceae bacterium]|jgi:phosphotransferase system HPr (HPr) family protein